MFLSIFKFNICKYIFEYFIVILNERRSLFLTNEIRYPEAFQQKCVNLV